MKKTLEIIGMVFLFLSIIVPVNGLIREMDWIPSIVRENDGLYFSERIMHCEFSDEDLDGDYDILCGTSWPGPNLAFYETIPIGNDQYNFTRHIIYSTPDAYSRGVAYGDLDGDGEEDIVWIDDRITITQPYDGLHWFRNNGNWNYTRHQIANFDYGEDVDIGDIDGDLDNDILYCGGNLAGFIGWYENDGVGGFTHHPLSGGSATIFCSLADMDNDNDLDILAAHDFDAGIYIHYNDGAGTFNRVFAHSSGDIASYWYVKAVDYNLDGFKDIAYSTLSVSRIAPNNGSGSFPTYFSVGGSGRGTDCGDLNGDNDIDCISIGSSKRYYLQNTSSSTWAGYDYIAGGSGNEDDATLIDFNNDGHLDAITPTEQGTTYLWISNGFLNHYPTINSVTPNVTFPVYPSTSVSYTIDATDIDGDNILYGIDCDYPNGGNVVMGSNNVLSCTSSVDSTVRVYVSDDGSSLNPVVDLKYGDYYNYQDNAYTVALPQEIFNQTQPDYVSAFQHPRPAWGNWTNCMLNNCLTGDGNAELNFNSWYSMNGTLWVDSDYTLPYGLNWRNAIAVIGNSNNVATYDLTVELYNYLTQSYDIVNHTYFVNPNTVNFYCNIVDIDVSTNYIQNNQLMYRYYIVATDNGPTGYTIGNAGTCNGVSVPATAGYRLVSNYLEYSLNTCIPDYQCVDGTECTIYDNRTCTSVKDVQGCFGDPFTGDLSLYNTCDYCTYNIYTGPFSACVDRQQSRVYYDLNWSSCCSLTYDFNGGIDCIENDTSIYQGNYTFTQSCGGGGGGGGGSCGDNQCTAPYEDEFNCPEDCAPAEETPTEEIKPPKFFLFENLDFNVLLREILALLKERFAQLLANPVMILVLVAGLFVITKLAKPQRKGKRRKKR